MMIICHYHVYRHLQYCRLLNALCMRIFYTTIAESIIFIKISQQSGYEFLFVMMIHVLTSFDHQNGCAATSVIPPIILISSHICILVYKLLKI